MIHLAYIPSPPAGAIELGPLTLRAYAFCIIAGIVVALVWGERRWRARGGEPGVVLDVAVWAIPFGIVGARLYHVATDWHRYFPHNPLGALEIWNGGLGIWGGIAFGALGVWIGCTIAGVRTPAFGDAVAPAVLLAQAIGRFGNWFNQEIYGGPTDLPWGLEIYRRVLPDGQVNNALGTSTGVVQAVVHPTFLYEALWNVAVVVVLVVVDRRIRIGHGRLFALYVAGYTLGRFFIEMMRTDEATRILGVRINVFTSVLVFLCAVVYLVLARKGRESPEELRWKTVGMVRAHPGMQPFPGNAGNRVGNPWEDSRTPGMAVDSEEDGVRGTIDVREDAGRAGVPEVGSEDVVSGQAPGWRTHASYGTGPSWDSTPAYGRGNYEPGPGYRSEAKYGTPPGVDGPPQVRGRGEDGNAGGTAAD